MLTYNGKIVRIKSKMGKLFKAVKTLCFIHHLTFDSWDSGSIIEVEGKMSARRFERLLRYFIQYNGDEEGGHSKDTCK